MLRLVLVAGCAGAAQEPEGWVDLFPGKDLKGWKRYPLDPTAPLAAKAVYRVSDDGKLLIVDGTGGTKEVLINGEERGDGIFHVEWRWGKVQDEKPNYNGGIYLRSSADGRTWIQAQVAHGPKPPVVGDLIGMLPVDGKPTRTDKLQAGPGREAPVGDWNTYEITCKGKSISLSVNGGTTLTWEDFPILRGHLGIQAEFANYEIRALRWKPLP
ncbi:MAG: DUF1080 domain-containing protein [Planctomycetaceae bacterium]|nr:DUF1080 domain-containing protein [Planctomycetaceae bacterium]